MDLLLALIGLIAVTVWSGYSVESAWLGAQRDHQQEFDELNSMKADLWNAYCKSIGVTSTMTAEMAQSISMSQLRSRIEYMSYLVDTECLDEDTDGDYEQLQTAC